MTMEDIRGIGRRQERESEAEAESKEMNKYIWVGYAKEPPNLPVAVADSASQLAYRMGVTRNLVESTWSKYRTGRYRTSRYHKVLIG